jgi:quaternary ammonium compound-resistance protein SugE
MMEPGRICRADGTRRRRRVGCRVRVGAWTLNRRSHNRRDISQDEHGACAELTNRGDVVAWLLVIVAGLFETGFAVLLKQSHGISRLWPTVGFAACALISFGLLTVALKKLEVGSAYAVWTGLGAAGTAVVGMWVLGESVSAVKLVSIGLILAGVIALSLSGVTPP